MCRIYSAGSLTIRIDDKLDSDLRELLAPYVKAQGWLTDEDVFAEVS